MKHRQTHLYAAISMAVLFACTLPAVADPECLPFSPAASQCPPMSLGDNLLETYMRNHEFEDPDSSVPLGSETCSNMDGPSAAEHWVIHNSNTASTVCTSLVPSTAPGSHGQWMLKVTAFPDGGMANESGPFQDVRGIVLEREDMGQGYMFSVWVFVRRGQVGVSSYGGTGCRPDLGDLQPHQVQAWSTKQGEWEQLRVCTNSRGFTDLLQIYNQILAGGEFFVDGAELRKFEPLE